MTYRIDRAPKRLFVKVDECGPQLSRVHLGEAVEAAIEELDDYGDANIYEYRLVSKEPRRRIRRGDAHE